MLIPYLVTDRSADYGTFLWGVALLTVLGSGLTALSF